MFGADTPLVMDALQMVAVAALAVGAGVYFFMRRPKSGPAVENKSGDLEGRVRVLERIATDQSIGLADEIEALRDNSKREEKAVQ